MAIIYTYPEINQVEGEDLLLISDTSLYKRPTRSVTIDNLAAYVGTVIGIGFWNLGTAPDSIFTTKMASIGQDANIASSKLNVYKTDDMTASVPHVATFNESLSNHSLNLWPSPGNNSADIYGSVSRGTFTGSGTVDQIKGIESIGRHSGSGSVNIIQGTHAAASLTGAGSVKTIAASYAKTFIEGTGSNNIENAFGAWNVVELDGLNDVDTIYGTYSNVVLTNGEVNDDAIGHFIGFDQVSADTEINNAYYIHAINNSLSVTGEKFFIKDETGIPSQFSNKLVLNAYGSGTFTGTATQRLAVDTNGNVIEIPIGSGPVDGSGTANYSARWIDTDTLGIGALYDNGTNVGIGTTSPSEKLEVSGGNIKGDGLIQVENSSDNNIIGKLIIDYGSGNNPRLNSVGGTEIDFQTDLVIRGNKGLYSDTSSSNGLIIGSQRANTPIKFLTSPVTHSTYSEAMRIAGNGNVGIGTTSPSQKLDVGGAINIQDGYTLRYNNSSNISILGSSSTGLTYTGVKHNFKAYDGSSSYSEYMTIDTGGNVGIGTINPSQKLTVLGIGSFGTSTSQTLVDYDGLNAVGNTDYIRFKVDNSEKLRITSTGNVGIGTTSPTAKLHVEDAANPKLLIKDSNGAGVYLQAFNGYGILSTVGSTANLRFGINDVEKIRIDTSGNVGIGTTSPAYILDVVSAGTATARLKSAGTGAISLRYENGSGFKSAAVVDNNGLYRLDATNISLNPTNNVGIGTTNPTTNLQLGSFGTADQEFRIESSGNSYFSVLTTNGVQKIYAGGAGTQSNEMAFYTSNSGAEGEAMRITSTGNVGIGTTSPSTNLEIVTSNPSNGINLTTNTGNLWGVLLNTNSNDFPVGKLALKFGSNETASITARSNEMRIGGSQMNITFYTSSSEKFRVDTNGNVGIGTTSPSQKLTVEGNIELGTGGYIYGDTTTSYLRLSNALGSLLGYSNAYIGLGPSFVYNVGGSEKFRISSSSGNVGIGTTNPGSQLEISKDSDDGTNAPVLSLTNASTTLSNGANIGIIQFKNSDLSGGGPHIATIKGVANSLDERTTELAFSTGNVATTNEAMRITSTGNVGIGTNNPSTRLHVDGDIRQEGSTYSVSITGGASITGDNHLDIAANASYLNLRSPNNSIFYRASSDHAFKDAGGSNEYLRIKTSGTTAGNVGIGTTNPTSALHVVGTQVYGGYVKFENTVHAIRLDLKSSSHTANIYMDGTGGVVSGGGLIFNAPTARTHFMESGTSKMSIISGNVGIGTTSPDYLFEVEKTTSGSATLASFKNTENTGIRISRTGASPGTSVFNVVNNGALYTSSDSHIAFQPGNSTSVFMQSTGNVGIGTTSPGAKLSVNGNVKIEGTNSLLFGGSASIPSWAINHNGSDLLIDDQGGNIGSVLFNNDEGVALPRLTTTEINAISLPAQGLMAYNTTLNTICFYNGSSWQKVSHTSM